jgi:hypothetical protein
VREKTSLQQGREGEKQHSLHVNVFSVMIPNQDKRRLL